MSERREQFGDTPELQDALAGRIAAGNKRATTSLARWYGDAGIPLPRIGETWIVLDGQRNERCRCRTVHVEVRRFCDVDPAHAAAEGEGDGSLERWREIHRAFFRREAARHAFVFDDDSPVLLERFDVL